MALDSALLECTVCLNLLVEPITTPCGHTFCRTCLVTALERSRKKCPNCRAPCHIDARVHQENVVLNNILKSCFPEIHSQRLAEAQRERETWHKTFPIFLYNDTIFPGATLSLHLFEPRYKIMIRRILEGNRQFCYLPNFTNYRPSTGDVGVIAEVEECEFLADGRALLQAKIKTRVRVLEQWCEEGTQGLFGCTVENVVDEPISNEAKLEIKNSITQNVTQQISRLPNEARQRIISALGEPPEDAVQLTYWVAAFLPMTPLAKYNLLKSTSLRDRYEVINAVLLRGRNHANEED